MRYGIYKEDLEIAKQNGIKAKTVYSRVYSLGWSTERAITEPIRTPFKINGKTIGQLAKENGIAYHLLRNRIQSYGWDLEKALNTPALSPKEYGSRGGRANSTFTEEQMKTAEENGIPRGTVSTRVHTYGWTIEKAITTPVDKRFRRKQVKEE